MAPQHSSQFDAIGTVWRIDIFDFLGAGEFAILMAELQKRIEAFDQAYSRFRADSLVTRISQSPGSYEMPDDLGPLWETYSQLYGITGGEMTPLIGSTLEDAGYDAAYSLVPGELGKPLPLDEVVEYEGGRLRTTAPLMLDFGAAGKGYLVDILSDILEEAGVRGYCVDAGGDMRHRSSGEPLRVGLEHPTDRSMVIGVAEIHDASICGSAGNRRAWDRFHHVISPSTLESPRHLQAVWAVAATTLVADALTTALYFKTPSALAKHYDFEFAYVRSDNRIEHSAGFPGTIFT